MGKKSFVNYDLTSARKGYGHELSWQFTLLIMNQPKFDISNIESSQLYFIHVSRQLHVEVLLIIKNYPRNILIIMNKKLKFQL